MNPLQTTFLLTVMTMAGQVLLAQQGPVAAGGDATGVGGAVSFSIGQVDHGAWLSGAAAVQEGLQHPYEWWVVALDEGGDAWSVEAWPNPATEWLRLRAEAPGQGQLRWRLHDMTGRLLAAERLDGAESLVSLEGLSAATYVLQVEGDAGVLRTFHILKR